MLRQGHHVYIKRGRFKHCIALVVDADWQSQIGLKKYTLGGTLSKRAMGRWRCQDLRRVRVKVGDGVKIIDGLFRKCAGKVVGFSNRGLLLEIWATKDWDRSIIFPTKLKRVTAIPYEFIERPKKRPAFGMRSMADVELTD